MTWTFLVQTRCDCSDLILTGSNWVLTGCDVSLWSCRRTMRPRRSRRSVWPSTLPGRPKVGGASLIQDLRTLLVSCWMCSEMTSAETMLPRDDANGANSLHSSNTILQSETRENDLVLFSINTEDALFTEAVSKNICGVSASFALAPCRVVTYQNFNSRYNTCEFPRFLLLIRYYNK